MSQALKTAPTTEKTSVLKAGPQEVAQKRAKKYIYAILFAGEVEKLDIEGIDQQKVEVIAAGRVAAVVSDISLSRIRPERRNLAAHQGVLKALMANSSPLPMAFGIIGASPAGVTKILTRNQRALIGQLERVAGKVEMGLRVTWDVPNIFEYFVRTNANLRQARDRFLGNYREATQEEKIELGRIFDRTLTEERDDFTEKVKRILAPICSELTANKCRNEHEVMNLACLVKRNAQENFSHAVFEAAKLFDNNFSFDYSGPWAPHNFVQLDLEL